MKKISWVFLGGWFLGALALIYQVVILLGVGDYPNYSDIVFVTSMQKVAYFISAIIGVFLLAITTIGYMISKKKAAGNQK